VIDANGQALANLLAVGGAACGVSGGQASGYLSGNGLLTAVAYGYLAGAEAARLASNELI
jgi:fumarate reductase flavoprotein subunit